MPKIKYETLNDLYRYACPKFSVVIQKECEKDYPLKTYQLTIMIYNESRDTFIGERKHTLKGAKKRVKELLELFQIST